MKILITGANGMLGEKCIARLAARHAIIATDLAPEPLNPAILTGHSYSPLDVTNKTAVSAILRAHEPEVIINCAAYTDVDGSEDKRAEAYAVNAGGVRNLLEGLINTSTHFIQISTDYIFDGAAGPYREEDQPHPINYYGWTKWQAEEILRDASNPVTVIRTNVLFGQSRYRAASFVDWVVRNLSAGKTIRVVHDQYNNPTWADGLADALAVIIERKATGLYHYGGADYVNRYEFARLIAEVFNLEVGLIMPITTECLNQRAKRPKRAGLVCTKIQEQLHLKLITLKEALSQMKGAGH